MGPGLLDIGHKMSMVAFDSFITEEAHYSGREQSYDFQDFGNLWLLLLLFSYDTVD